MRELRIREMLEAMESRGASDLLLTAGAPPQLRIHGALLPYGDQPLTAEATRQLAYSLLSQEQVARLSEVRSLSFSKGFEGLSRFRISIYFQREAIALAIRIIPFEIPGFVELGLPEIVREFASRPHGLVLVTGPAGSGKSTTLAAMIDFINDTRKEHVVCIEDPIEYLHLHRESIIDQIEVGEDARTFTEALRSVFRQSPDVIMVGEMRDLETIQMVLTLAETGHLILATLHTQDATHAVNRIVDVFPAEQQQQVYLQLSLVLAGVISQQLLATREGTRRVLACEVMAVNDAIRNLIREMEVQQVYSAIQTGKMAGMMTMNDSLLEHCRGGLVDTELAMRRSPRPRELVTLLDREGLV